MKKLFPGLFPMTNTLNTASEILVVSPNLFVGLASLGQHLLNWHSAGKSVNLINVFSQFGPETDQLSQNAWNYLLKHRFSSVRELSQSSLKDEQKIQSIAPFPVVSLGLSDAAFRRFGDIAVYSTHQSLVSGHPSTYDSRIPEEIISHLPLSPSTLILCPFAVSSHADHQLLRRVGTLLERQKYSVKYYLESPYLWRDLTYLKYSFHLLRAQSYLREVTQKQSLLENLRQFSTLVRPDETFAEIIL